MNNQTPTEILSQLSPEQIDEVSLLMKYSDEINRLAKCDIQISIRTDNAILTLDPKLYKQ